MDEIIYNIKKKYSELDSWIATLEAGTYNVEVDCTGVGADQFLGSYYSASSFGEKLKKTKPNVFFNLKFGFPDEVIDASYCFSNNDTKKINCLKTINITSARGVKIANYMFYKCHNVVYIDASAFIELINASCMFENCIDLISVSCSAFTKVADTSGMFQGCSKLSSLDCSAFISVETGNNMFWECSNLTDIYTDNPLLFNKSGVAPSRYIETIFTNKKTKNILLDYMPRENNITYYELKEKFTYIVTSIDDNKKVNYNNKYINGNLSLNNDVNIGGSLNIVGNMNISNNIDVNGDISGNNAKFNNLMGNLTSKKVNGDEGKFKTITVDGNTVVNDLKKDYEEKWIDF